MRRFKLCKKFSKHPAAFDLLVVAHSCAVLIIAARLETGAVEPHLQCKCYRSSDTLNSLYQYIVIQGL